MLLFGAGIVGASVTEEKDNNIPLKIDQYWEVCPVQNYQPQVDPGVLDCRPIQLPAAWESVIPDYNGIALLHSQFSLPQIYANVPLGISIKRVRDADKTFINGQLIGSTGEFPPNFDKGVLHTRIYSIPMGLLKFDEPNQILIWVYNDARNGGLTSSVPIIDQHTSLIQNRYEYNFRALALVIVLLLFSLLHLIYFIFFRHSKDNLYYALFLISWSGWLYTFSDLSVESGIALSTIFRMNVAFFFSIFALFPLFSYRFFHQKIPLVLKVILGFAMAFIPLTFLLPEPKLVYYLLELIELSTVVALLMVYWMLINAIRARLPYAKLVTSVVLIYTLVGSVDILLDYTQTEILDDLLPYGPWALLILTVVLTGILAHKNLGYYQDATFDRLTETLRFKEFLSRLELELFRSDREKHPLVLLMLDLDDFKTINDNFGHIQGDKVLAMVSESLKAQLRHFDLVGRYGGDEFCVAAILENDGEIRNFVKRLHTAINQLSFEKHKLNHQIKATFGAVIRQPGETLVPKELIENADSLLIEAKANNKGSILW